MGGFFKKIGQGLGFVKSDAEVAGNRAFNQYKDIQTPQLQALSLQNLGPSQFEGLSQDPLTVQAQNRALEGFLTDANQQGLSEGDLAKYKQVQQQQALANQAQQGAITSNAAMRGIRNAGLSLASQMIGQQGTMNRANQSGNDIIANSDLRRQNALQALGGLGSTIAGQRFDMGAKRVAAADEIARYNNQLANQSQIYNRTQLPQQQFENQRSLAADRANILLKKGAMSQSDSGVGNAMSTLGAIGMGLFSDERLKTNIDSSGKDMGKFLDKISASSWDYKDKSFGEGKHAGPMAQELESTELGKSAVIDTPIGKMVHSGKAAALALAGTKVLHERLKKLEKK